MGSLGFHFFSVFNKVVSLLAVVLYVRWTLPYLGQERFGVWMTLSTFVAFINVFLDFGLGGSLVNHIAYSKARNNLRDLKEFTSSAFFFLLTAAVFFAILYYFISPLLVSSLGNGLNTSDQDEVRNSLLLLIGFFLISLPFITVDKTLEGLQLLYISSAWATVGNIISLIVTYIVTRNMLGIEWLIFSTVGIQCLFRIVYFFVEFNTRLRDGRPSLGSVKIDRALALVKSGMVLFLLNIFNVLAFQIDNFIISETSGVGEVPLFSLMQKLVAVSFFFWIYTTSLWPVFAEAHSKKDKAWIKKTVWFVLKLNSLIGIAFGLLILFFSGQILSLWTNNMVAQPSFAMKLGFALYIVLNGLIGTVAIVYNTGPLLKKQIIGFCMATVSSILLKFLFIKNLGIDYLMFMTFFPFLIFYVIPCFIKLREYVKA